MKYNSTLLEQHNMRSIIDNGCDLRSAFSLVLNYFDPNKSCNRKTPVLDCSYSHIWNENDIKLYSIDQTKNLKGSVADKKYDIIIYEPPRNKTFFQDAQNSSKIFNNVINEDGMIIVKMNDFKERGKSELRGSFDIWDIFSDNGFYLFDNIIYNYRNNYNAHINVFDRSEIVHLYFMIFKKH